MANLHAHRGVALTSPQHPNRTLRRPFAQSGITPTPPIHRSVWLRDWWRNAAIARSASGLTNRGSSARLSRRTTNIAYPNRHSWLREVHRLIRGCRWRHLGACGEKPGSTSQTIDHGPVLSKGVAMSRRCCGLASRCRSDARIVRRSVKLLRTRLCDAARTCPNVLVIRWRRIVDHTASSGRVQPSRSQTHGRTGLVTGARMLRRSGAK
jgi:hypothetical protein